MKIYIEGYRSHNQKLYNLVRDASWFYGLKLLGGRMARHIILDIKLTKDLKKKDNSYGYCHITGELENPREFMIEVDASMKYPFDQILIWIAHEFVHLKQFVRKELCDYETGRVQWKSRSYGRVKYDDMPWEKEAYRLEEKLYNEFTEWYYE